MPGEAIKVPVTLDLSEKSGATSATVALWVDGKEEPFEFSIKGEVFQEYPAKMSFDSFRRGESVSRSFILRPFPGQPSVEILDFHVNSSYATVKWAPTTHMAGSVEVTLSAKEDVPYGYFETPVVFVTNDAEVTRKFLKLSGYVLSPLETTKTEIVFGHLRHDAAIFEEFDLWSPYGLPLEIVGVENSRAGVFRCTTESQSDPSRISVRVSVSNVLPADVIGLVKAEVVFHVKVGEDPQKARVEVYGFG